MSVRDDMVHTCDDVRCTRSEITQPVKGNASVLLKLRQTRPEKKHKLNGPC